MCFLVFVFVGELDFTPVGLELKDGEYSDRSPRTGKGPLMVGRGVCVEDGPRGR